MATSPKKNGKRSGGSRTSSAKKKGAAKSGTGKKGTSSKARKTKAKEAEQRQIGAIILFGVSLLLFCIAFIPSAGIWGNLRQFCFGCFGIGFYIWPFVLLYVAFMASIQKDYQNLKIQVLEVAGLVWLICSAVFIGYNTDDMVGGLASAIEEAYHAGGVHTNGGVFGALFGGLLLLITGGSKAPAMVITIILILVMILIITGTTLNRLAKNIATPVKKAGEATKESFEQHAAKNEERQKQRALQREQRTALKQRNGYHFNPDVPLGPEYNGPDAEGAAGKDGHSAEKGAAGVAAAGAAAAGTGIANVAETPNLDGIIANMPKKRASGAEISEIHGADETGAKDTSASAASDETASTEKATPSAAGKTEGKPYRLPPLSCLKLPKMSFGGSYEQELRDNAQKLVEVLQSFGVKTTIVDIARGPSVTRYELAPATGVKISKITGLADDLALNLAATSIRIEAPIPGKAAVGIEVPNKVRESVTLREILESDTYRKGTKKSLLNVALGRDISGQTCVADLAKMPHLLIAGTTGSGKSVCLNTMILSILYNANPEEVKMVMIDPKKVEFTVYNGIPHLLVPVVAEPKQAAGALDWAVKEMLKRYKTFSEHNVRDIHGYNELVEMDPDPEKKKMPHVVIFIDELADLMMATPKEVEDSICRLAQMARAAGMHLVIATQRPSADVITGLIKANIPSRLSLSVSSAIDSRIILDMTGAEKLLGNGDMLFNPIGSTKPTRIQGCFTSDGEVEEVVSYIKKQGEAQYSEEVMKDMEAATQKAETKKGSDGGANAPSGEKKAKDEEALRSAIQVVVEAGRASTSLLQRKLSMGYATAGRLIDELEDRGVIGPYEGSKPRKVLITKNQWLEMNAMSDRPDDGTAAAIELGLDENGPSQS